MTTQFPTYAQAAALLTAKGLKDTGATSRQDDGERRYWAFGDGTDAMTDHSATVTPIRSGGRVVWFVSLFGRAAEAAPSAAQTQETAVEKPTIELRNITHNERLSDETHCYSARLYVDGVLWGEVSNHGHGGCDNFHPVKGRSYDDLKALDERIAAAYPKITLFETPMNTSLEIICGDLVNDFLVARDMRRALRSKVMFVRPGETAVRYFPMKSKGRTYSADVLIAHINKTAQGARILNTMPEAEALTLYRAG